MYDIFDRSDSPFSEMAFAETSRENFERIIFDQKKFSCFDLSMLIYVIVCLFNCI